MELPGTQGAASPFWSPDSESVAFFAVGDLKRVDRTGGAVTTIGPAAGGVRGAWSPDGQVFMNTLGFGRITQVVPASGGQPIPVPDVQDTPYLLPDGQHYVYRDFAEDGRPLFIASLGSNERTPLELRIDTLPVVYSQGHLLFVRDGALMAQPFDARVLELSGEAAVLAEDVSVGTLMPGGGVFSVSETGVLVYQKTPRDVDSTLMWLDRRGAPGGVVAESGAYSTVELSPDARQAAVTIFDPATGSRGIWLFDLSRPGIRTPFTTDFPGGNPVWTPDGSRIVFMDDRETGQAVLAERMVGRTGSMDILLDDSYNNRPTSWSPDGDLLLFTKTSSYLSPVGTFGDVWGYPMEGDREPFPILQTPAREHHGRLSPDGRWMAYSSDESGRTEVYVVPFPDLQTTTPVSANGGSIPRWSRDGTELVYLGADDMLMAVSLTEVDERLEVGPAQPLFQVRPPPARAGQRVVGGAYIYDVMPDGRFLVNMADGEPEPSSIEVVLNWLDMLEE